MIQFDFPVRIEDFQIVRSKEHLKTLLFDEAQRLNSKQWFRITERRPRHIYLKCRCCNARMKYLLDEEIFKLTYDQIRHNHLSKKSENSQIVAFIRSLPISMTTNSLMQLTTQRFKITRSKFYYLNKKIWCSKLPFIQIIKQLQQKNEIRYIPYPLLQGDLPDIFLLASQIMIQNFKQFGENQFVTFDITYNIVKQSKQYKDSEGNTKTKKWGLGTFLGKNSWNKAIPFCYCLINSEKTQDFIALFRSFFQMMHGQPATFITDQQHSISAALNALKQNGQYKGYHLLDSFHIIRNINKKTKNKQFSTILSQALFAKTINQYEKQIELAQQYASQFDDVRIHKRFIENSQKYCLSQTPVCFQGVSISTSFSEQVNDFIKKFLPTQKPFKIVVKKLISVFQTLQQKSKSAKFCKYPFQSIFAWKQLKAIRQIVCQSIFIAILKNYIESLSFTVGEEGRLILIDNHELEIYDNQYRCACGYLNKTGIPCCHLLKVITQYHEDIFNYIHKRWIMPSKEKLTCIITKKGRERNSRRYR